MRALLVVALLALGCTGELDPMGPDPEGRDPGGGGGGGADASPPQRLRIVDGEANGGARLRDEPGGGSTITVIPLGCLVDPIGPPNLGWLPVRYQQTEGWVYGAFVDPVDAGEADCN